MYAYTYAMIVSVAGLKGGLGKTLLSLHLAGEAATRGCKVLLADADAQRTALTWAACARRYPVADKLPAWRRRLPDVVGVTTAIASELPHLAHGYDLVIVDCPPRGDVMTRAALLLSHVVLLPTGPSPTEHWSLPRTLALVDAARAVRSDLRAHIVLNGVRPRHDLTARLREALAGSPTPVLRAALGRRDVYAKSLATGQTVATYAPKSEAASEIRAVLDELEKGDPHAIKTAAV